jgi:hypothetical protein
MPRPELSADKELLFAFYRLDNESIMFINKEPIPITHPIFHKLADSFTTLWEAKTQFEVLLRVFSHSIVYSYAWGSPSKEAEYRAPGCEPMPKNPFAE